MYATVPLIPQGLVVTRASITTHHSAVSLEPARKRETRVSAKDRGRVALKVLRFEMGLGATSSEAERLEVKVVVIRELLPSYLAYIL